MVTNPVERIRTFAHETPLALDLAATLARLAAAPPSTEAPYLTVTLDWRPEGTEPGRIAAPEPKRSERRAQRGDSGPQRRPSWQVLGRNLDEMVKEHGPRGAAFDSLSADLERIAAYIEDELDPAAQGVIVVACDRQGVFEPIALDVPVASGYALGPIPSLRHLVQAGQSPPPHAVLVADQRDAVLWLMERQTWDRSVQLEADDYPRKQKQGGWSQKRYQARADERVEAFAKTIAEETRREIAEGDAQIPSLVISTDEPMASALNAAFHQTVSERIIGHIPLDPEFGITQIAAAAAPLVEQEERKREQEAVQAVCDGVGAGGRGVAGPQDTVTALEAGQVMTLVVNDDFEMKGWADFSLPLFGVGDVPAQHPAGGDVANIVPVAFADAALRLALQTDAGIELVATDVPVSEAEQAHIPDAGDPIPRSPAARSLDELGGIGAVLRFALAEGQPTAENA